MPDGGRALVTNTTPLIALAVATGGLDVLRTLYSRVVVPVAVAEEILAAGEDAPGVVAFRSAGWLERAQECAISPFLRNSLDRGEAAVIQTALDLNLSLVCIDETVGRRIARLNGLTVTGSVGILVKARQVGFAVDMVSTPCAGCASMGFGSPTMLSVLRLKKQQSRSSAYNKAFGSLDTRVVAHAEEELRIRIISARQATARERSGYEGSRCRARVPSRQLAEARKTDPLCLIREMGRWCARGISTYRPIRFTCAVEAADAR